jgi:hypothetical protein
LGNLFSLPIMGLVVMPMVVTITALGGMFPDLGNSAVMVAAYGIDSLMQGAHWVARLPYASLAIAQPPLTILILSIIGLCLVCLVRGAVWIRAAAVVVMIAWAALSLGGQAEVYAVLPSKGSSIALIDGDTLWLSRKTDRFTRDALRARFGGLTVQTIDLSRRQAPRGYVCLDAEGYQCLWTAPNGQKIGLWLGYKTDLAPLCAQAEVILSPWYISAAKRQACHQATQFFERNRRQATGGALMVADGKGVWFPSDPASRRQRIWVPQPPDEGNRRNLK